MCSYYGLKPDIKVISPWREWDLTSRSTLIKYAESRGIEVPSSKRGEPPFSMDANLLHISYEGYTLASIHPSCLCSDLDLVNLPSEPLVTCERE